jgi:Arc/MetJ family transcription regulator
MAKRYLTNGDPTVFLRALADYYATTLPETVDELFRHLLLTYAQNVADAAAREAGTTANHADVDAFTNKYLDSFGSRHAASSRRQVEKIVNTPPVEGAPPVTEMLDTRLDEWLAGSDTRLPRETKLATREARKLEGAVARTVWAGAGILVLRWVADADSCPLCESLNGQVVGIDIPFVAKDESYAGTGDAAEIQPRTNILHPPLHDGCDCHIVPGR